MFAKASNVTDIIIILFGFFTGIFMSTNNEGFIQFLGFLSIVTTIIYAVICLYERRIKNERS